MGNTGARVGIGILPNVEFSIGTKLVAYEMTRKVHGGYISGGTKVGIELNLVRAGLEHLVGVFGTKTESLSALDGIYASGKDAGDDERGNEEAAHNEEGGKGMSPSKSDEQTRPDKGRRTGCCHVSASLTLFVFRAFRICRVGSQSLSLVRPVWPTLRRRGRLLARCRTWIEDSVLAGVGGSAYFGAGMDGRREHVSLYKIRCSERRGGASEACGRVTGD